MNSDLSKLDREISKKDIEASLREVYETKKLLITTKCCGESYEVYSFDIDPNTHYDIKKDEHGVPYVEINEWTEWKVTTVEYFGTNNVLYRTKGDTTQVKIFTSNHRACIGQTKRIEDDEYNLNLGIKIAYMNALKKMHIINYGLAEKERRSLIEG